MNMKTILSIRQISVVKWFLFFYLFTFLPLNMVADDGIRLRSCRRGVLLPTTRSQHASSLQLHAGGDFYHGNRHQMVVLVSFPDRKFLDDEATTLTKWDKIFNAENYHEDSFEGSVHDYFYAQSYGQFNLTFDLFYVNLPDSTMRYHSTADHDEYSQYMVDNIVDTLQTLDIDWSQYDWNGDGYVNQLLIIYAGEGMNTSSDPNTIWPHQWWLSKHLKNPDKQSEVYRDYRTVTSGDKQFVIDCYCCVQEVVNISVAKSSFGIICHEYTHCFGFPDFYNGTTKYVGGWELMDSGNYNNLGYNPAGYSAHERWLMGWCKLTELNSATEVSAMPALSDEPQAYLIRNDDYVDEYYIVENRQQRGWDSYLPGSGLVVFHVDFDEEVWSGINDYPNSNRRKRYTIFPANNNTSGSYSGWAYPYQDNNSLTDTSQPAAQLWHARSDSIFLMSKPMTNITVNEDGLASFDFMKSPDAIQTIVSVSDATQQWFDLQGRQLPGRPQHKGLYIVGGRKVVVR